MWCFKFYQLNGIFWQFTLNFHITVNGQYCPSEKYGTFNLVAYHSESQFFKYIYESKIKYWMWTWKCPSLSKTLSRYRYRKSNNICKQTEKILNNNAGLFDALDSFDDCLSSNLPWPQLFFFDPGPILACDRRLGSASDILFENKRDIAQHDSTPTRLGKGNRV